MLLVRNPRIFAREPATTSDLSHGIQEGNAANFLKYKLCFHLPPAQTVDGINVYKYRQFLAKATLSYFDTTIVRIAMPIHPPTPKPRAKLAQDYTRGGKELPGQVHHNTVQFSTAARHKQHSTRQYSTNSATCLHAAQHSSTVQDSTAQRITNSTAQHSTTQQHNTKTQHNKAQHRMSNITTLLELQQR